MVKILFISFLILANIVFCAAFVRCNNGRLCPAEYSCSKDGTHCCNTLVCKRSRLTPLDDSDMRPITEEILCDRYLQVEDKLKCGDEEIIIRHFEACTQVYSPYNVLNDGHEALGCTEQCIRSNLGRDCKTVEEQASGFYSFCAAECNFCFVPEAWPLFVQIYGQSNEKIQIFSDLGRRCNIIYGMSRSFMTHEFLVGKIEEFVREIKHLSGVDLQPNFKVLNKSLRSLLKYGNNANQTDKNPEPPKESPSNDQLELSLQNELNTQQATLNYYLFTVYVAICIALLSELCLARVAQCLRTYFLANQNNQLNAN